MRLPAALAIATLAAACGSSKVMPAAERPDADDYWSLGDAGSEEAIVYPDAGRDSGTPIGTDGGIPISGDAVIRRVDPDRGGASVATRVVISGKNFAAVDRVEVGGVAATDVHQTDSQTIEATFQPVEMTQVGLKDVAVIFVNQSAAVRAGAFEYWFDEDPIVFVHGFMGASWNWSVMIDRFKAVGYPESHLNALDFSDVTASSLENLPQLSAYVDAVLAKTGATQVDLVIHSMGGISSRLWIKQGGFSKVRDYMSVSGAHHGTDDAYLYWSDGAQELRPPYACDGDSLNNLQYLLNGCLAQSGRIVEVDETPYGIEDGFGIAYHAIVSTTDEIVIPHQSGCLNQKQKNDCSDPVNTTVSWQGHGSVLVSADIFNKTLAHLRLRNRSK